MKIDENITIEDLVTKYPKSVKFLMNQGIVCIQCGEPVWGTLKENAEKAGIKDIPDLVKKLNLFLEENSPESKK